MSLDVAYSIEAQDYLDPDRAYDLYWSGVITDKRRFLCPGSNCTAQVTCANLDEDLQDMKVVPHFRIYGQHSKDCEISNNLPLKLQYEDGTPVKEERLSVDQSIVDIFELERPESYYDEPRNDDSPEAARHKKPKHAKKINGTRLRESGSIGTVYSVRSVVSRYIRYRTDGSIKFRRLNIAGMDVYYSTIFKCIWEQDLDELPETPAIYYGWAYINRLPSNSGYQIKFKKKLKQGDHELTTTAMISDSMIEKYKIKKLMATRLEKVHKKEKPTAFVFLYAQPEVGTSKSGIKYANFHLKNLDMIDVNYECPLPNEYNK
ncbi:hypothetical protein P3W55_11245 [Pseudomonas citronellolis]|uniref:Uncharacterized protein n=1 Tax=Pseudomonas citronellolis TaxID=53408 RepID=A0AAW6P531_9PSED|nr:hypothetical protein [Pseudomonas citronellolis]KRV73400.1 hypothetical protein AO742_04030 [Pseudomonas citronellolis]MDF3842282.1 hypothetical protein [Pseudomonas citronellolis]WRT85134.1 hypothetical protein VK748_12120 [Pseudomonas citronellolis]